VVTALQGMQVAENSSIYTNIQSYIQRSVLCTNVLLLVFCIALLLFDCQAAWLSMTDRNQRSVCSGCIALLLFCYCAALLSTSLAEYAGDRSQRRRSLRGAVEPALQLLYCFTEYKSLLLRAGYEGGREAEGGGDACGGSKASGRQACGQED
jgi:hypothetical protein